jgi:hypothetical protein
VQRQLFDVIRPRLPAKDNSARANFNREIAHSPIGAILNAPFEIAGECCRCGCHSSTITRRASLPPRFSEPITISGIG